MLKNILLSINPKYTIEIINGTKKFEFRKKLASKKVRKIVIYETSPSKQIIGEAQVIETIAMKPLELWNLSMTNAGISKKDFLDYFKKCDIAYAYVLGEVTKYENPVTLETIGLKQGPQSFIYLEKEQYELVLENA